MTAVRRRLPLGLGLVAGALVYLAASTPTVAHALPHLLFPLVGATGAALALLALARAVAAVARADDPMAARLGAVGLNAAVVVVLVVLPGQHLVRALVPPGDGTPPILTGFGDWSGAEGYPLFARHRGIDVAARPGADVIAAAPGRVSVARDNRDLCGLIVVIDHEPGEYRTVYCHAAELTVRAGDRVERGARIGVVGTTGQRAWPGFEHVHLELQRGRDRNALEDPRGRLAGCFDPGQPYPSDRLVLTFPVRC